MSNHGSIKDSYGSDYVDTTRNFTDQVPNMLAGPFLSNESQAPHLQQHSYTPVQQYPHFTHGFSNAYGSAYNYTYDSQWTPLSLPQVTYFTPVKGSATTRVQVWLQTHHDFDNVPGLNFFIHFREKRVNTSLDKVGQHDNICIYMLAAESPLLHISSPVETIRLSLQIEDGTGHDYPLLAIGDFTYEQPTRPVSRSPATQVMSKKRRLSTDDLEPAKRYASGYLETRPKAEPRRNTVVGASDPDAVGILSRETSQIYGPIPPMTRSYIPPSYIGETYLQPPGYSAAISNVSEVNLTNSGREVSPRGVKSQRPYHTVPSGSDRPSSRSMGQASQPLAVPISSDLAEPQLIRTSTLQTAADTTEPAALTRARGQFHHYPSRAVLKIIGDLDNMVKDWTAEELSAQRRLIEFQRSQQGNVISTSFKPIRLEDRVPNSICISCIWWEGKGEAYVTSVDTIYLLESLVAVRFTVEEKNRIRRNLEGFRPLTVAKGKPDSDDFFRLIMGFPSPRPRNIEKDVKAFPWRILSDALKKIIGKYSASYSTPPENINSRSMTPSHSLESTFSGESRRVSAASPSSVPISRSATMQGTRVASQNRTPLINGNIHQLHHAEHRKVPETTSTQTTGAHPNQSGNVGMSEPRLNATHGLQLQSPLHFDSHWMQQSAVERPIAQAYSMQSAQVRPQNPQVSAQSRRSLQTDPQSQQYHNQQQQQQQQFEQKYQQPQQPKPRQASAPQFLRASWDYSNFIETSPTLTTTPTSLSSSENNPSATTRTSQQQHAHASQVWPVE